LGISVYRHKPNPLIGNVDPLADLGIWICAHLPGLHQYSSPPDWVYNHISLGPGMLAVALRLHWLCAYLFMLNGLVFVIGSAMGGGWRSLLPRRTDLRDALKMLLLHGPAPCQTNAPHLAASALQHKIQRTSTRRLFFLPQTMLATHLNGKPLTVEHGAPLRLVVPVKLGLKNIKAITRITYTKDEPPDYWAKRGYSHYDGI
jgi:hypothetical protein